MYAWVLLVYDAMVELYANTIKHVASVFLIIKDESWKEIEDTLTCHISQNTLDRDYD